MTDETPKKQITRKQQAFIDAYLVCFNGAEAARRAGYTPKNASDTGSDLLANPDISRIIDARMAEVHMSANEALKLTADIARGDIAQLMDITSMGGSLDLKKAQELGLTKLIKKFKQRTTIRNAKTEDGEDSETHDIEIELYDAQAAIRDILKVHGKFIDRTDLTSGGDKLENPYIGMSKADLLKLAADLINADKSK